MHSLILGITGTGKTTLAKQLSFRSERNVIVCEPYPTNGWNANQVFTSVDDLMQCALQNKNLDIFIDESGETMQRNPAYQFLATRSRQYGHRVFFIAQRAQQVLPVIRNNCECYYIFRQSRMDCELLVRDTAEEKFYECEKLMKGEYLFRDQLGKTPKKYKLFK